MSSTAPRSGSIGSDSGSCPFRAGYRFSIARRERPLSIISTCRSPLWQRACAAPHFDSTTAILLTRCGGSQDAKREIAPSARLRRPTSGR
jgi:hypothetical protein